MAAIDLPEDQKVTIPPIPEIVADKLWSLGINIQTPSTQTEGSVRFHYCPWTGNPADEAVQRDTALRDTTKVVNIPDLYAAKAQCPELQEVWDSIIKNMPAILAWQLKREADAAKAAKEAVVEE